jgi:MOSC domain-containing protein YiiM
MPYKTAEDPVTLFFSPTNLQDLSKKYTLPLTILGITLVLTIFLWNTIFPIPPIPPNVVGLNVSSDHHFSKKPVKSFNLIKGLGIENDAHAGETVQHLSRMHVKPPPANLRQVHLMMMEMLAKLDLKPGDIGENITTGNIDLLKLGRGTKLRFVDADTVERMEADTSLLKDAPTLVVTGLRNPCHQIEKFRKGLQEEFIVRDEQRSIIERKAGIMSTVEVGGEVRAGMRILVEHPEVWEKLDVV